MTGRRFARLAAWCALGVVALLVSGVIVVRSPWFREQVRRRIVREVETATGGRVEAGAFTFDWIRLRAEVRGLVVHGTEAAGKPPLFRASSVAVGLMVVSLLRRKFDIAYLDVAEPRVYLILYPDGRSNVPEPKVHGKRSTVDALLDLAVGRFSLQNGEFEVESREPTSFSARGRNLNARLGYDRAGPRYRAEVSIQPLDLDISGYAPTAVAVALRFAVERNRVTIDSARLAAGDSHVEFSGVVDNLASPRATLRYEAQASQADVARFLLTKLLVSGAAHVSGEATWAAAGSFSVTGKLNAYNLEYRDAYVRLRDFRADGALKAGPAGLDIIGLRLSGFYARPDTLIPIDGRIARAEVRGPDIHFIGMAFAGMGGVYEADGLLQHLDLFHFEGAITGFQARRVVAVYSPAPLPWDGRASGPLELQGSLQRGGSLHVTGRLAISPEPGGAPVHGQVNADYDTSSGVLDLGRSTLTLPSSRVDFSGAIGGADGGRMRAHLETRDLDDLLPAVGETTASVGVKLENGSAVFDGSVEGSLDDPHIAGHLSATRFSVSGQFFDSLAGDAAVSPENARLDNATVARGGLRAQFQAAVALREWKSSPESEIFGNATLRNAPLAELATAIEWAGPTVAGSLNATAEAAGTLSNPLVKADIEALRGRFAEEPFDRIAAHLNYSARRVEVASAQIAAGTKQVQLKASYDHAAGILDTGLLRFEITTNAMPLEQIATLEKARSGVKGTVQASAGGSIRIEPASRVRHGFQILDLRADVAAHGLQLDDQSFGDAHLTAATEGQTLKAHLESNVASSSITGDGSWRLEDDYPGSANIAFSRLDYARLHQWIAPSKSAAPETFEGFAEGGLRIDGPALRPRDLEAELRIPKFEIGPAPGALSLRAGAAPLVIRNAEPMVATLANSVFTVESAHLVGRATDLTIGGKIQFDRDNALDLRVNGRIDLGFLQDFGADILSAGGVLVTASVRGAFDKPQIGGRLEVQNGSLSVADFSNGLDNANGVISFSGDRATIQSLAGESGGGKIRISGFAGYGGDQVVFNLHADADAVRVRYPEGVSTVANASLDLNGTAERSMLVGSITVLRTGFNPQSDFSSLLARSSEPVQTPSARGGLLGGLNYDIQIQTAPDIQVRSALTQDLDLEANLRLRGTVSTPALQGRINITQGQVLFAGTKFTISQGSIAFYNLVKVEPIINVDLETKVRGADITLTIAGPLSKLTFTPRSDPPLQLDEIVAALATGQTPASDPTLLASQSTSPNSWQQMGATALLGQAIASPVTGRLQRFFGVSRLRIDPALPGIEYNPQARLSLEQQITPNITFTYITVVNSSNPQVVRVEWDLSKQWSVVALREENGLFGLDFFFKKQLK
jgi:translocation and assembly module TamB